MRNIKILFSIFSLLSVFTLYAQVAPNYYAIEFTDKNDNGYSLDNPEAFLTQRSIDRRANQGIGYDETDLPITDSYVQQVAEIEVEVKRRVKWINTILIKTTDPSKIDDILALPFVASATKIADQTSFSPLKPKYFFELEEGITSEQHMANDQKSISSLSYGNAYDQIDLINGIPLHDLGYMGQGMVIAILDGGFIGVPDRIVFDSLWDHGRILGARDFASEANDPFSESTHGTKVLSTMGANWPGQMVGTAPMASYWLLKTEYVNYENIIEEYNWLVGAAFADSVGADVINSSLGYTTFDDPSMDHNWSEINGNTTIVTRGADMAAHKGILPVNSAGNDGYSDWQYVGFPADGDSVLAVGAVDYYGQIAGFSSRGYPLDPRIKPNICAVGSNTVVADAYNDFITTGSGTSFSSPTIAGMTACLWQANPGFTNQDIMNALQASSSQSNNPDKTYGYGIPDYALANSLVGTNEISKKENLLKFSPNPADNKVYFSESFERIPLAIYNQLGQLVYETNFTGHSLDISHLISGIYILKLGDQSAKLMVK